MAQANFVHATTRITELSSLDGDDAYRAVQRLERVILNHMPKRPHEAVAMLDLIIPDLSAGGRSDGLDIIALAKIRTMLHGL